MAPPLEIDVLDKLRSILNKDEQKGFTKVLLVDILVGLFQAVGVASILPFINMIMDISVIHSNHWYAYFYDNLGFQNNTSFIFAVGIVVLVLLFVGDGLSAFAVWFKTAFTWDLDYRVSVSLLRKYLSMPYAHLLNKNTSELSKNILSEVNSFTGNFLYSVLNIVEGLVISFMIVLMLFITNPSVTALVIFILGSLYLIIYLTFSRGIKAKGKMRIEENKSKYKSVGEALGGLKYTKVAGKENYFLDEYASHARIFSTLQAWNNVVGKAPKYIMEIVAFGGIIAIVLVSMMNNYNSETIFPFIALFAFSGYRLLPALQGIYDSYTVFRFNRPSLDKIYDDLSEDSEFNDATLDDRSDIEKMKFEEKIAVKGLTFSYSEDRKKVLENINLSVKKNSFVAFAGATGSGKTTLVDILLGLLIPEKGEIYIDDELLENDNKKMWQKNVGYVPQEIYLCDDTVTKNIAFGVKDKDIDMKKVKNAAKMAQIDDFIINELGDGYDTQIGERGVRLSGGQRQRLGIARALYDDPEILILDEATSALDSITERELLRAIESVSKFKTMIVIAHRLTTIKDCDNIYFLKDGKIIASGTFDYLVKNSKDFKEMAKGVK